MNAGANPVMQDFFGQNMGGVDLSQFDADSIGLLLQSMNIDPSTISSPEDLQRILEVLAAQQWDQGQDAQM